MLSDRSKVTQNKINFVKNCPQWGLSSQPPSVETHYFRGWSHHKEMFILQGTEGASASGIQILKGETCRRNVVFLLYYVLIFLVFKIKMLRSTFAFLFTGFKSTWYLSCAQNGGSALVQISCDVTAYSNVSKMPRCGNHGSWKFESYKLDTLPGCLQTNYDYLIIAWFMIPVPSCWEPKKSHHDRTQKENADKGWIELLQTHNSSNDFTTYSYFRRSVLY